MNGPRSSALTPGLIAIVGFLTVCPVVMLVLGSFSQGLGAFGTFTLEKYIQAYTDPDFADIILNTVIFGPHRPFGRPTPFTDHDAAWVPWAQPERPGRWPPRGISLILWRLEDRYLTQESESSAVGEFSGAHADT